MHGQSVVGSLKECATTSSPRRARRHATTIPPGIIPAPGMRLGPYRLCFEIASGGMATVFLASAEGRAGIHRFVALKCLRPELACQPDFAGMFLDEARIASQIHHPNVCSVLDVDDSGDVSYMAMEYVIGESLAFVRRRLTEELEAWNPVVHAALVARIVADVSEGLHAAHELVDHHGEPSNVVHRDIAPDNIMITYDGCVKVLDFGVSLSCQNRQETRSGVVKGKVSYLSPEVLQGERPDRRSDVWALGVVAWELLTGRRLFDGATDLETLRAISDKEIAPPSRVRRGIPVAVDRIVMRALERDPARRPATARELGKQMNRFLANRRMAFGLAELAGAMDQLFPSGRAAKRQLLDMAEQLDDASMVVPLTTCEIEIDAPAAQPTDGGQSTGLARRTRTFALRNRGRLTGLALAACLLMSGWSWLNRPDEPRTTPVERALGDSGFVLSVSPVEATDDALLLRVEMVRAGAPAARAYQTMKLSPPPPAKAVAESSPSAAAWN